jgi:Type IV secretory pathway, protease TraF
LVADGRRVLEPPVFQEIAERKNGHCGYVTTEHFGGPKFPLASSTDRITLGADEYLLLGDNSTNSFDGRYWGAAKRQSIIGKAVMIHAPPARARNLQ